MGEHTPWPPYWRGFSCGSLCGQTRGARWKQQGGGDNRGRQTARRGGIGQQRGDASQIGGYAAKSQNGTFFAVSPGRYSHCLVRLLQL